jgi:type II secretory pathway component PulJ
MSRINTKWDAFTLQELMITLALTVLITGMAYFTYHMAGRSFSEYEKINKQVQTQCNLQALLGAMVHRCNVILKRRNGFEFIMNEQTNQKINISEKYILLTAGESTADTIHVPVESYQLCWESDSVIPVNGPVQKIRLDVNFFGKRYPLIFEKLYDSEKLIALDSLNKILR